MSDNRISKRVIVVGLPKAGTSSIDFSLSNAGYVTCHQMYKKHNASILIDNCLNAGNPAFSKIETIILNDVKTSQVKVGYTQMDFCLMNGPSIWPQLTHLDAICNSYLNAYFVLNYRDTKSHVSSISNWYNLQQKLTRHNIKGLPTGKGKEDKDIFDWIERSFEETTSFFMKNKSLRFLPLKIDEPNAGELLSSFLQEELVWTHKNKSKVKTRK